MRDCQRTKGLFCSGLWEKKRINTACGASRGHVLGTAAVEGGTTPTVSTILRPSALLEDKSGRRNVKTCTLCDSA